MDTHRKGLPQEILSKLEQFLITPDEPIYASIEAEYHETTLAFGRKCFCLATCAALYLFSEKCQLLKVFALLSMRRLALVGQTVIIRMVKEGQDFSISSNEAVPLFKLLVKVTRELNFGRKSCKLPKTECDIDLVPSTDQIPRHFIKKKVLAKAAVSGHGIDKNDLKELDTLNISDDTFVIRGMIGRGRVKPIAETFACLPGVKRIVFENFLTPKFSSFFSSLFNHAKAVEEIIFYGYKQTEKIPKSVPFTLVEESSIVRVTFRNCTGKFPIMFFAALNVQFFSITFDGCTITKEDYVKITKQLIKHNISGEICLKKNVIGDEFPYGPVKSLAMKANSLCRITIDSMDCDGSLALSAIQKSNAPLTSISLNRLPFKTSLSSIKIELPETLANFDVSNSAFPTPSFLGLMKIVFYSDRHNPFYFQARKIHVKPISYSIFGKELKIEEARPNTKAIDWSGNEIENEESFFKLLETQTHLRWLLVDDTANIWNPLLSFIKAISLKKLDLTIRSEGAAAFLDQLKDINSLKRLVLTFKKGDESLQLDHILETLSLDEFGVSGLPNSDTFDRVWSTINSRSIIFPSEDIALFENDALGLKLQEIPQTQSFAWHVQTMLNKVECPDL